VLHLELLVHLRKRTKAVAPINFLPYLITPSPSQTYAQIQSTYILFTLDAGTTSAEMRDAYHGKYRARANKVTQSIEERSFFHILIVLLSKFLGWNNQLDRNKLVSFSLESGQDLINL
jgi:hypothetical protein